MSELCFSTAIALRDLIRSRRASVTEVLEAHLAQIARVIAARASAGAGPGGTG